MKQTLSFILCILFFSTVACANQSELYKLTHSCVCPKCNLSNAQLQGFGITSKAFAKHPSCSLHCNISGSNLSYAVLNNANVTTCTRGYRTPFATANFSQVNLSYAQLKNVTFIGIDLSHANLSFANLYSANFFLTNFSHANLSYANLTGATCIIDAMHGWGCDMRHTNFSNANLTNAQLYASFRGANFNHANLTNAHLTTSRDATTTPRTTVKKLWQGVNFSNANLTGAVIKTLYGEHTDLSAAIFCNTTMPDGAINNRDCGK